MARKAQVLSPTVTTMVLAMLLLALGLAPAAGRLAWLHGGHVLPDDLALHNWLSFVYPLADHHELLSGTAGRPEQAQARGVAFALSGNVGSVVLAGLAAVLPAAVLLLWRLWTKAVGAGASRQPPTCAHIPDTPPPR